MVYQCVDGYLLRGDGLQAKKRKKVRNEMFEIIENK